MSVFNFNNHVCMWPVLMTLLVSVLQVVLITVYESHLISFCAVHSSLWCHTSTDYFSVSLSVNVMASSSHEGTQMLLNVFFDKDQAFYAFYFMHWSAT